MTEIEAPRIFVCRRYRDSKKIIAWLEKAFGFQPHMIVENDQGEIIHAQIAFGSSMMMLGDHRDDDYAKAVGAPGGADGGGGQSIYIAVDDPDALYRRAMATGAVIFRKPEDTDYGSREFGCHDPEGQSWNFGSYWPRADEPPET